MNYPEAQKKGTQGPYSVTGWTVFGRGGSVAVATAEKKHDAALLAHKWNHFDKLLEAYKKEFEGRYHDEATAIIQAAEEVEGI